MNDSPFIYRHPTVSSLVDYYGKTLFPSLDSSVESHLELLAQKMFIGLQKNQECLYTEINNYHPKYLGVSKGILSQIKFSREDCRITIANEFGFSTWKDVTMYGNENYNLDFEHCIADILKGDTQALSNRLDEDPSIIFTQSQYGHKATLLHYTASNGVEMWRQQVPENLVEIIQLLLSKGANKNAKMNVYGGQFSTFQLLSTSAHHSIAGIDKDSLHKLFS